MKAYISNIKATTKGLDPLDEFYDWSENPVLPSGEISIDVSMIPPMLRRRCSKASKISLSLCLPLLEKIDVDAGVFCSQHGELSNTVAIFKDLINNDVVSPNKFSQCVHNTASGLMSVHKKLHIPFNSIAAGKETFQMGLVEAFSQLMDYDNVLFSIFDDVVPNVYDGLEISYNLDYGVSFIISDRPISNDSQLISIDMYNGINDLENSNVPPALLFVAWLINNNKTLNLPKLKITKMECNND